MANIKKMKESSKAPAKGNVGKRPGGPKKDSSIMKIAPKGKK